MRRVLWIFNHYAITPEFPGGTRHFELAQALVQKGWEVVIFAANFIHMDHTTVQNEPGKKYRKDDFGNLHFVWIKTNRYIRNDWRRLISMFSYCLGAYSVSRDLLRRKVIGKPDVIVGSTVHPFAPLISAFIARRLHVPFILEIRDLWPQTFIDMGVWRPYSLMSIVFRCIER